MDTHNEPGLSSGLQAKIYYYVNDTQYISYDLLPSRKHKVGEKYKLKYSIKDPNTYEVLWDEQVLGEEPKEDSSE